ncbi:MAG: hypothetical protein Ct9H300mP15_02320 [Gemmatimonadota bacterium]|nr:MAG: hypothetical protein Ct9H300mP15_02320 [Gemmatimonadota bacterium]
MDLKYARPFSKVLFRFPIGATFDVYLMDFELSELVVNLPARSYLVLSRIHKRGLASQ